jgi:hypothetical protein
MNFNYLVGESQEYYVWLGDPSFYMCRYIRAITLSYSTPQLTCMKTLTLATAVTSWLANSRANTNTNTRRPVTRYVALLPGHEVVVAVLGGDGHFLRGYVGCKGPDR